MLCILNSYLQTCKGRLGNGSKCQHFFWFSVCSLGALSDKLGRTEDNVFTTDHVAWMVVFFFKVKVLKFLFILYICTLSVIKYGLWISPSNNTRIAVQFVCFLSSIKPWLTSCSNSTFRKPMEAGWSFWQVSDVHDGW